MAKLADLNNAKVRLDVQFPTKKAVGYIEDVENVSLQTTKGMLASTSEEECLVSGELYKYAGMENGMKTFEKCKTDGERADVFVQYTLTPLSGQFEDKDKNCVSMIEKRRVVDFVEISTKCTAEMQITEAVEYGDWLMVDANGGLKKWTSTGNKVAKAKETTKAAGVIKVEFGCGL